jgi:hypothetical protein
MTIWLAVLATVIFICSTCLSKQEQQKETSDRISKETYVSEARTAKVAAAATTSLHTVSRALGAVA